MMYKANFKIIFVTITFLLGAATSALAEQIIVPVGQQASDKQAMDRPANGTLKDQVEEKFGTPEVKNAAVGDPPISSWEYPDFVVYFEYERVLHSVLKRDTGSSDSHD